MVVLPPASKLLILSVLRISLKGQTKAMIVPTISSCLGPTLPMIPPKAIRTDATQQEDLVMRIWSILMNSPDISLKIFCQSALKRTQSCMTMALMRKVQARAEQAWVLMKVMRKPKPMSIMTLVSCQAPYLSQKRGSLVMMAWLSIILTKMAKKRRITSSRTRRSLPKDFNEASATLSEFINFLVLWILCLNYGICYLLLTRIDSQNQFSKQITDCQGDTHSRQDVTIGPLLRKNMEKYYSKESEMEEGNLDFGELLDQQMMLLPSDCLHHKHQFQEINHYDKKLDHVVASSISMISMIPSSEFIYGRLSSIQRKNFQPILSFKEFRSCQKRPISSRFKTYMIHIELLIFYFLSHSNFPMCSPAPSKTSSSSSGHFLVSWGSKQPKYPFLALRNRCAYLGVPPMIAKKQGEDIISARVSRYSFYALSRPILDMIKMTMFSFSVLIQLRKMELSLHTVTLYVRLKFYRALLSMNPASHGVYHQNSFLWGQSEREIQVRVCNEKGISLLSQKSGAIVCNLAAYFLKSKLATAIWVTLSMHPHPESESQQVVGKIFLMLLRQVSRMYSQSSQTFLLPKKVNRDANIRILYQLISINNLNILFSS